MLRSLLTLAIYAVAAALNPLKVCHHKTCSKNGLAKRTLDIAHVLGGPEAAVQTLECQNGCNAGTVSVVGRRLYDVERASAATCVEINCVNQPVPLVHPKILH